MVDETTAASAVAIADSILAAFEPRSVVDVGCGTGALLDRLRGSGVAVKGLEYTETGLRYCLRRGLEVERFDIERDVLPARYTGADLVVSMEVGQALDPAKSERYVGLLCRVADIVIFSSAVPGQDKVIPRNPRPHSFWRATFESLGFDLDESLTLAWRSEWLAKGTATWFSSNVMVIRRTLTRS